MSIANEHCEKTGSKQKESVPVDMNALKTTDCAVPMIYGIVFKNLDHTVILVLLTL